MIRVSELVVPSFDEPVYWDVEITFRLWGLVGRETITVESRNAVPASVLAGMAFQCEVVYTLGAYALDNELGFKVLSVRPVPRVRVVPQ